MTTKTHPVALVNMKDGSVAGHKAGCADLKHKSKQADEPYTLGVATKHDAWMDYNSDFIAECEDDPDHDETTGSCSHAWTITWARCADHVPEFARSTPKATKATPAKTASATKAKTTRADFACGCGCGAATKGTYAPGHDARHAGQVARAAVEAGSWQRATTYAELPTPALVAKARAHAARLAAKIKETK